MNQTSLFPGTEGFIVLDYLFHVGWSILPVNLVAYQIPVRRRFGGAFGAYVRIMVSYSIGV